MNDKDAPTRAWRSEYDDRALVDRLHKLSAVLSAMACDTATARREAAQLRKENAQLIQRLRELESAIA